MSERASEYRVSGVFFASGPGFWEIRPAFWLFMAVASVCLVFVSRMLGWGGLSALLIGACASRRGWRRREARRVASG